MLMVEFKTKVKNGSIEIPAQYRTNFKDRVRVILMTDEDKAHTPTLIDELLAHPLNVKEFRPLSREQAHDRK